MKKISKIVLSILMLVIIVGCSGTDKDKENAKKEAEDYTKEVTDLATSKGYTVEEVAALQHGQRVDKAYDNEVLERFGKIMVYEYHLTGTWNDGMNEGPFERDDYAYGIGTAEEYLEKNAYLNSYEDAKHFDKTSAEISGYIVVDAFYNGDYSARSYNYTDEQLNGASGDDAPVYMDVNKLKGILDVLGYENKWYRVTDNKETGNQEKQLIFPLVLE